MSEVGDACQIILVTGKGAYYLGKITTQAAMMVMKVMNTVYLSKWNGVTTLNRFRAIKGDEFMFINISTENRIDLQGIYKEMQDHGILLAQLPDLCGGDGRTQVVISPSDAAKFKAFLLDHSAGKYKDIKVGQISAEDYARTGYDSQNKETPEMSDLTESAKTSLKEQEQLEMRKASGLLNRLGFRRNNERFDPVDMPLKEDSKNLRFQPVNPAVIYQLEKHDQEVREENSIRWVTDQPIKRHEKWRMYEMPDGVHAVVIPNQDCYEFPSEKGGILYRAALYNDQMYNIINLATGDMKMVKGEQVELELDKTDFRTENRELKNLCKNLGISSLPSIKSRDELPYTTLAFTPKNAFDSDLIDGPYIMRIPDAYSPNGYKKIDFYKSDCEMLEDGITMEIRIPKERSQSGGTEFIKVDRDFDSQSISFGTPGENGFRIKLPVASESDQDFTVQFKRPYYDRISNGQRLEIHIDPSKPFTANFGNAVSDRRQEKIYGSDILKRFNHAIIKTQDEELNSDEQKSISRKGKESPEITKHASR